MVGQQWYHHPARFGASGDARKLPMADKKRGVPPSLHNLFGQMMIHGIQSRLKVCFAQSPPCFWIISIIYHQQPTFLLVIPCIILKKNLVFFPFKDITPLEGT